MWERNAFEKSTLLGCDLDCSKGQRKYARRDSLRRDVSSRVERHQAEVILPDAGESRLMTAGYFIGEIVVSLVFLDRTAERRARLYAGVSRIGDVAERIGGLEVAVADVPIHIAVKCVRSGAGDDVDDAARGASVLGGIAVGQDLEFLHCFLRHGGANTVDGVVDGIGTIDVHQVGAGTLSAHVQAGGGGGPDVGSVVAHNLRVGEREVDVVAAVDGEIVDAALIDGVGGGAAAGLYQFGF